MSEGLYCWECAMLQWGSRAAGSSRPVGLRTMQCLHTQSETAWVQCLSLWLAAAGLCLQPRDTKVSGRTPDGFIQPTRTTSRGESLTFIRISWKPCLFFMSASLFLSLFMAFISLRLKWHPVGYTISHWLNLIIRHNYKEFPVCCVTINYHAADILTCWSSWWI